MNSKQTAGGSNNGLLDPSNQNLTSTSILNQSKDFQTMISVLKDMGVDDYEPRVINQLLEFSYRWFNFSSLFYNCIMNLLNK